MPNTTPLPKNWPPHVQYINLQHYHSSVSPAVQSHIRGVPPKTGRYDCPISRRSIVIIRTIVSPAHPACGQFGLFALKKIPPRTHIIDYLGEIHCDDRPDSDYDISLYRFPDGVSVGSDASRMGNEARFVNDYRGVIGRPNVEFRERRTEAGELRMSIWTLAEPVKKGEELVVSYGKAWWAARMVHTSEDKFMKRSYWS